MLICSMEEKNMRLIPDEAFARQWRKLGSVYDRVKFLKNCYRLIGIDHFVRDHDDMAQAQDSGTLGRNFGGYTISRRMP